MMVVHVENTADNDFEIEDDGKHLWSSILEKVQENCRVNLPLRKSLVIMGDNNAGKTSLAARLQRTDDPKESKGLEYHFVDVKDESRDESTRMGVWILDGDSYHSNLLKFALTEESVGDCMILLVASLSEPWKIIDSLKQWSDILEKHVNRLKLSSEVLEELKNSLIRHYQEYSPPTDDSADATSGAAPTSSSSRSRHTVNPLHPPASADPEKVLLPLGEGVFSRNFGVPIVVVLTKSDTVTSVLEREMDYKEEHLDFIQFHVRRFCLEHGAGLFYLSVKEDRNCELLSRYLQHRIYGFPFSTAAYVVEKDCIFVPAGWDNSKKIGILTENLVSIRPSAPFSDVIVRPPAPRKSGRDQRDTEAVAEDEQVFLMRQQTAIQRSGPAGDTGGGSGPGGKDDGSMRGPGVGGSGGGARGKPGMGPAGVPGGAPGQEGVLANFFNSLLSKKPGTGGPGAGGSPTPNMGPQRGNLSRQGSKSGPDLVRRQKSGVNGQQRSPVSPQPQSGVKASSSPDSPSTPEKDDEVTEPEAPESAPEMPDAVPDEQQQLEEPVEAAE